MYLYAFLCTYVFCVNDLATNDLCCFGTNSALCVTLLLHEPSIAPMGTNKAFLNLNLKSRSCNVEPLVIQPTQLTDSSPDCVCCLLSYWQLGMRNRPQHCPVKGAESVVKGCSCATGSVTNGGLGGGGGGQRQRGSGQWF